MLCQYQNQRYGLYALILALCLIINGCGGQVAEATSKANLTITTTALPTIIVGRPYSFQITATGGVPGSYRWSATHLPNGITINASTGLISGTTFDTINQAQITITVTSK